MPSQKANLPTNCPCRVNNDKNSDCVPGLTLDPCTFMCVSPPTFDPPCSQIWSVMCLTTPLPPTAVWVSAYPSHQHRPIANSTLEKSQMVARAEKRQIAYIIICCQNIEGVLNPEFGGTALVTILFSKKIFLARNAFEIRQRSVASQNDP